MFQFYEILQSALDDLREECDGVILKGDWNSREGLDIE